MFIYLSFILPFQVVCVCDGGLSTWLEGPLWGYCQTL